MALIEAIDRDAFGAHFNPVNLINSPRRYYDNAALIREEVSKLDGVPLIMEHMDRNQYPVAAKYIRSKGKEIGLVFQPETNE